MELQKMRRLELRIWRDKVVNCGSASFETNLIYTEQCIASRLLLLLLTLH